jgi:hypothetical protein
MDDARGNQNGVGHDADRLFFPLFHILFRDGTRRELNDAREGVVFKLLDPNDFCG